MKKNRYLNKALAALLFAAALPLSAQESAGAQASQAAAETSAAIRQSDEGQGESQLSRSVVVERDYEARKIEAEKINAVPERESGYKPDSTNLEWAEGGEVQKLSPKAAKAAHNPYNLTDKGNAKDGIGRLAFGFYYQVLADFYYPLLKGDQYLLDINLRHRSSWSRISLTDGTKPRAMNNLTDGSLNFESQFSSCRLVSSLDFSGGGFDYYGRSTALRPSEFLKDTASTFITAAADFKLYSTDISEELQYDARAGYRYFGRSFGIRQHDINLSLDMSGELRNGRIGGEAEVNVHLHGRDAYLGDRILPIYGTDADLMFKHNALVTLTPYYKWEREKWSLRAGADVYLFAGKDKMEGTLLYGKATVLAAPNVRGSFGLVPNLLQLTAGITGNYKDNNYRSLFAENNYIYPALDIAPTYTPVSVDLGLKINIMKGLLFELGFDYDLIYDDYFYVNLPAENGAYSAVSRYASGTSAAAYSNVFGALHESRANKVNAKVGLLISVVEGLDIKIEGNYYYWALKDNARPWQRPSWEITFDGKYSFLEKWQVGLSYNFLGGRYALVSGAEQRMTDVHDLNVSLSYKALDWLTVYAEGKNLINNKADGWYGYQNYGINGVVGVFMFF